MCTFTGLGPVPWVSRWGLVGARGGCVGLSVVRLGVFLRRQAGCPCGRVGGGLLCFSASVWRWCLCPPGFLAVSGLGVVGWCGQGLVPLRFRSGAFGPFTSYPLPFTLYLVRKMEKKKGVPPSWFRGRDPATTLAQFQQAWCVGGVLASVSLPAQQGARYVLAVSLTVRSVPGHHLVDAL
jgi:hypothetical protein